MPGTIVQEMTRILGRLRSRGVDTVWLSQENLQALQNRPGQYQVFSARPTVQPAVPQAQQPVMRPGILARGKEPAVPQANEAQPVQRPAVPQANVMPVQQTTPQSPKPAPTVPSQPSTIDPAAAAEHAQIIKTADLNRLAALADGCSLCGLSSVCGHKLPYAGAPKVRVLFIGDVPTVEENATGIPFNGQAGQMLFNMGKAMGLQWDADAPQRTAAGYATILKCRPAQLPSEPQINACLPFIQRQIELLEPDTLVLLGAIPTKALTGKTGFSKLKGTWETYLGIPALLIQSPSFIVRFANQPQTFKQERMDAWLALQEAMKSLQLK